MVTPGSRQGRGYAVQICILLKNVPNLDLGDSKEFPPLKILTARTIGRYISINDKISVEDLEDVGDVSRVNKTPTSLPPTVTTDVSASFAEFRASNSRLISNQTRDYRRLGDSHAEVLSKIEHLEKAFLNSLSEQDQAFRGMIKNIRQEAHNDADVFSMKLEAARTQNVILRTELADVRYDSFEYTISNKITKGEGTILTERNFRHKERTDSKAIICLNWKESMVAIGSYKCLELRRQCQSYFGRLYAVYRGRYTKFAQIWIYDILALTKRRLPFGGAGYTVIESVTNWLLKQFEKFKVFVNSSCVCVLSFGVARSSPRERLDDWVFTVSRSSLEVSWYGLKYGFGLEDQLRAILDHPFLIFFSKLPIDIFPKPKTLFTHPYMIRLPEFGRSTLSGDTTFGNPSSRPKFLYQFGAGRKPDGGDRIEVS
ncbi:hypothetical protein F511_10054 [Dorcoceras hygrometricum]|uniref:Uncharacterized protein n=1 Tax=Dorcoceras hygrometricum TaxID=472368 RepID=A0A2Z7C680_9LAMI|nr:hypothetical protein F511_10054 [Dorcoceras hygrometricum]